MNPGSKLSLPYYDPMTPAQIQRLHDDALRLLAQVGIRVDHDSVLDLMQAAGAAVDAGKRSIRFPPALVEASLQQAPRRVLLAGQDPDHDLDLVVGGPVYGRTVGGSEYVLHPITGDRKPALGTDIVDWVRVVHACEHLQLVNNIYAHDMPLGSRDVTGLVALLEHTTKPIVLAPYGAANVEWMVRMAGLVAGASEELRRRPRIGVYVSMKAPLALSRAEAGVLITAGKYGMPVFANSSPTLGATGPVSLAGAMLLMAAETLAQITLIQVANPGAPLIWSPKPLTFDMRTTIAAVGAPELMLLEGLVTQLGRHYGLPSETWGLCSDAHACDEQAALEKALRAQWSQLTGTNIIGGAGMLGSSVTVSLAQLVIDDEILGYLRRIGEGMRFDEEALAYDALVRVGYDGEYLSDEHTFRHFRRELVRSDLPSRDRYQEWADLGAKDIVVRAQERADRILARPPEPCLSPELVQELKDMADHAVAEIG